MVVKIRYPVHCKNKVPLFYLTTLLGIISSLNLLNCDFKCVKCLLDVMCACELKEDISNTLASYLGNISHYVHVSGIYLNTDNQIMNIKYVYI